MIINVVTIEYIDPILQYSDEAIEVQGTYVVEDPSA
jgi:hypothetical protein